MKYVRMPIEIESPEQMGWENIDCNLTESSVSDMSLGDLGLELKDLTLAYTDHLGKPELRELIASESNDLRPDDVVVTVGAAAALFIVATSLLDKDDHLVVARPNYATNIETPRAIGCAISFLDLAFENGYQFDLDRLRSLITPRTKLISLTTPHNPTGAVISEAEIRAVAGIAEEHGCRFLLDETYRELRFGPAPPLAASISPRAISVSSLSKSFGLPGIRIGWVITRDKALRESLLAAKEQIFICNSVVDEHVASHVLKNKERLLPGIVARSRDALNCMKSWMAAQLDVEWIEPRGGVCCFPRIRRDAGIDTDRFYRILNQKYRTFVGPGHWFEQDRRHFRVGYSWPKPEQLRRGLANVSLALTEAKQ
jgi:aspartate/methionine/tyrosine aminotransferase